jgi:cytochrome c oxidase subunit II
MLAGCAQHSAEHRRIRIVMKKYAFDLPVVRLKQGETVILEVSSAAVPHGFEVPDLKIREPVQRNQPPAVVTLTAARKGEFPVQCGIIGGPGHDGMIGKIVVQ